MTQTAESTAGTGNTRVLTAGLDLLTARERHADELAFACAAALQDRGGHQITVTTHHAALGEHRHVGLVVEVTGSSEEVVAETLSEVVAASGEAEHGLLVGRIYCGTIELRPVIEAMLGTHRWRTSGRVVVFPGSATVTGTTTVAQLLASTAIDRIQVLGHVQADPGTPLTTRDFVRPRWSDGDLVLHVQPAIGDTLVPFETPNPTPCCADHA
jgi:hypothetical protein